MHLNFGATIILYSLLIVSMASAARRIHLKHVGRHGHYEAPLIRHKYSGDFHHVHLEAAPFVRHSKKQRAVEPEQLTTMMPIVDMASAECESSYVTRITEHCRYPGMSEPCFALPAGETSNTSKKNFLTAVSGPVMEMAQSCCTDGRLCSAQEFEKLCCRTPDCLARCYGTDFFNNRKKIGADDADCSQEPSAGSARSRGKTRRGKSHFRFLDLLVRPNPSRHNQHQRQQRHFEDDYE